MTGNVTCYNVLGGSFMRYPGNNNTLSGTISYNDSAFTLSSTNGVTSNGDTYCRTGAVPSLQWDGQAYTLAGFQQASGEDQQSAVADPKFANVPSNGFVAAAAATYNFCTQLDQELCKTF
jgi:hypothetical protein